MINKIGLVTFYKDNFGSILQCYATMRIVEQMGFDCIVLSQEDQLKKKDIECIRRVKRIGFLLSNFISDPTFYWRWKKRHGSPLSLTSETWNRMDKFVEESIKPMEYTWDQLVEKGKEYKGFIIGSDQVWNAYNPIPPIQFLKFAPDNKKIAFAVSFGTDNPSKAFLNTIRHGIEGFKRVSVREESGIKIIRQGKFDVEVERIADPTLMLDLLEWRDFCRNVEIPDDDYILVHFLDHPSDAAIKIIEKLRTKSGFRIICIAYKYDIYSKYGWGYMDCDPREYVALIDRASSICTDSFHTTLFSINLGKDFLVFERQYLHGHSQRARIRDLLVRFGLEDRYKYIEDYVTTSDVLSTRDLLEKERKLTREYLMKEIRGLDESL